MQNNHVGLEGAVMGEGVRDRRVTGTTMTENLGLIFFLSYFILRERERERESKQGRGRERKRVPSRLQALSTEHVEGPELTNCEIMT